MLLSPFTFLRGAAEVMAHDLSSTPTTGDRVQACGDAHLLNFGVFATPERHLVFDVNDFDETLPGPWEWDVKRLAASIAVAGRGAQFAPEQVDDAVESMVRAYRVRMAELSTMSPLDVWYERVDVDAVLALSTEQGMPSLPTAGHLVERARHHTSLQSLPKLTELVDGERRIIEDPPLILHAHHRFDVPRSAFEAYRTSVSRERRALLDRYRVVDAARKVVGVGSVGTRCHIVLLMDADGAAPLFLQIKEAEVSVLSPYAGRSECEHEGERVVTGQRLMQAASDVFLGWADDAYGNQYYLRQLRDMKGSVSIDLLTPDDLTRYAMLCGVTLARAHARSGDPAAISGYLGTGPQFDRAIVVVRRRLRRPDGRGPRRARAGGGRRSHRGGAQPMTAEQPPEPTEADDAITRSRMERLKLEQARMVGRLEGYRKQLEAKRPNSKIIDTALGAFEKDVAAGGGVLAGAVAFRVFLFMIPYVFLLVVIFGLGASAASEDPGSLARDAGIGGLAAKAFAGIGDLSTGQRILSFFVAAFALLLATRALLKVLRIVHALVWHTRAGKPASAIRAAGALVLVVTLALAISALIGQLRSTSFLAGLVATVFFIAIPVGLWLFVSWYMPRDPDVPWTALLPGAIVFGLGLEVLHLITVYWIANQIEHKTDTYGAIGFALALLLWAYLLGRLITSAAVVNETLWSRELERRRARAAARARRSPGVGHEPSGHAAGDPARLGGEHGGAERQDQHVAGHERRDPLVEPGLGAERGDDQGELAPGQDRGREVRGGDPSES